MGREVRYYDQLRADLVRPTGRQARVAETINKRRTNMDWFTQLGGLVQIIIVASVYYTLKWIFRTIKVAIRGWLPAHVDADGDWESRGSD